jgi:four helix bundle protein
MESIKKYRDLIVWQRAVELAEGVYLESRQFPKEEIYGLTSQIRRAAVSIASNIAEGHGRNSRGEFKQFLGYALGSLAELETQIILATRFSYLTPNASDRLLKICEEVSKMLNGLKKTLS